MDLLVSSFIGDFARVATFQITNSVGQPRMRWLGIDEGHHGGRNPGENRIRMALVAPLDECLDAAKRINSLLTVL